MSTVGFLKPVYTELSEYIHDVCSSKLAVELSDKLSAVAARISSVAESLWSYVDTTRKSIDDLFLFYQHGASSFIKSALSSLTARFVLYSLNELTGEEYQENADMQLTMLISEGSDAAIRKFPTTQNATLSVATLLHAQNKNPNRQTIVYFPANFDIWQASIDFLIRLHKSTNTNIHAINYRGTGGSDGFPEVEDTLINDGIAYVKNLIQSGVQPGKIALFGGSIGAGVCLAVAARLADENIVVNTIPLRSYKVLADIIAQVLPVAAHSTARFAAKMGWKLDSQAVLPKLRGHMICMYSEQDPMVPVARSIKNAIETAPAGSLQLASIEYVEMHEDDFAKECPQRVEDPDCNPHIRPFAPSEEAALAAAINRLWLRTL